MTIGDVRRKLESNYSKHYENVKMYYQKDPNKATQYIQEQTGCDYSIADQIIREWMNKQTIQYEANENPQNNILYNDLHQIAGDLRFIKNFIIIGLILSILFGIISGLGVL